MIVPAFVLAMQKAGLGKINSDLFWEEYPQYGQYEGLCVISRADGGTDNDAQQVSLDILSVYDRKLDTELALRDVINWLRGDAQELCTLSVNPRDLASSAPNETITYHIYSIEQTGTTVVRAIDQNNRIIKGITVTIKFNEGGQE